MFRNIAFALTVAAAAAAQANAQATATPAQRQPGAQAGVQYGEQAGGAAAFDQAIAACLLLGNQEEIALGRFASERAQNERVKEFARKMIEDHTQASQKLQQIAPQLASWNLQLSAAGTTQPRQGVNQPGQNQTGQAQFGQTAGQAGQPQAQLHQGQGAGANSQLVALQRRVAEECLQLTQQELEQHRGEEFDMAYMGQQCGAHIAMLAKLRGSQDFATGQLQQTIQELARTVEQHYEMAKQIKQSLKSETAGSRAAQRPADTATTRQ